MLTQGPAYGLLLRNELAVRTARHAPLNVGQVYTTLDRLLAAELVDILRNTPDGHPRYILTSRGELEAAQWLRTPAVDPANPWESMRFQVLLARSLPGVTSDSLVRGYQDFWHAQAVAGVNEPSLAAAEGGDPVPTLASSARSMLAQAALAWLEVVAVSSDDGEPVQLTRPPKGRPAGPTSR